jgi:hypothetical protein
MKMNVKALAITIGAVWAACVLFVGVAHLLWPAYGGTCLDVIASVYPGFHPASGAGAVIVGTVYAFVDGTIGGVAVGWVYNTACG